MSKWRKKPLLVEATQWFKHGDHPEMEMLKLWEENIKETVFLSEGLEIFMRMLRYYRRRKIVRYFQHPNVDIGDISCKHCDDIPRNHGWIDTLEGGHIVCPGDWIITGIKGEKHPCKNDVFEATYEKVEMK